MGLNISGPGSSNGRAFGVNSDLGGIFSASKIFTVSQIMHSSIIRTALPWRHDVHDVVSNFRRLDCLLSRLFRRRSEKTSKFCVTGLCEGNSPVTDEFPAQMASNAEMFPFDDVIMSEMSLSTFPPHLVHTCRRLSDTSVSCRHGNWHTYRSDARNHTDLLCPHNLQEEI